MSLKDKLRSPSAKRYFSTFITEITVMVLSVLLYRVCLVNFGDDDFSVFSIYRRNFSFLLPLLILGLGVGLPRYVSLHLKDPQRISAYYTGVSAIILIVCLVANLILFLFADSFSELIYGDEKYSYLILPLVLMLDGALIYTISYSLFRGKLSMALANSMQLVFIGLIPFLSLMLCDSLYSALVCNGILWISLAIIGWFIGFISVGGKFIWQLSMTKEIFLYGIYRLPGDMALGFFFLLPVIVVIQYTGDTIIGGYMAFGITLINLVGSLFTPICVILLAESGNMIAEKKYDQLLSVAKKIMGLVLVLVVPGVLVFELFTEFLIEIYLSQANELIIFICRILFLSSIGYALYIALRSILDALFVKPINSFFILISLAAFGAFCLFYQFYSQNLDILLYGFVISVSLLGVLTVHKTFHSIKRLIKNTEP